MNKLMKASAILILLLASLFGYSDLATSPVPVCFGERDLTTSKLALYFDKQGILYPDYKIETVSLLAEDASLKKWYKKYPNRFIEVGKLYNLNFSEFSSENFLRFQDSVLLRIAKKLNLAASNKESISFLIHGFRKPFESMENEYSSPEDYQLLETTLNRFRTKSNVDVEIYWDSNYACCISKNIRTNNVIYELFVETQKNAANVGIGVRKMLNEIKSKKINIITHSLGARVADQALFNLEDIDSQVPTPNNERINICLIAPATDGVAVYKKYWDRTTSFDYRTNDNYRLAILYNENDVVLKKEVRRFHITFGPGPFKHGVTTLGCNYDGTATKVKQYFSLNYLSSYIELFNLNEVGGYHYLGIGYASKSHLKGLVRFIEE